MKKLVRIAFFSVEIRIYEKKALPLRQTNHKHCNEIQIATNLVLMLCCARPNLRANQTASQMGNHQPDIYSYRQESGCLGRNT
jgi:hypothetical protein